MILKGTDKDYTKTVRIALFVIAIIIVAILLFKRCGNKSGNEPKIKIDTVYKEVKGETVYVPKVDTIYFTRTTTKNIPYRIYDTLFLPELVELEPDTAAIVANYTKAYLYSDTVRNKYGNIIINDTLTRNRIYGRGVKTYLLIPEVTKTITLVQPKRNQLYFGGGLFGNEEKILQGYEAGLMFKSKQDRVLSLSYNQIFNGQHYYKAGLYFKLSFKK